MPLGLQIDFCRPLQLSRVVGNSLFNGTSVLALICEMTILALSVCLHHAGPSIRT